MTSLFYHVRTKKVLQCSGCSRCSKYFDCDKINLPPSHSIMFSYDKEKEFLYFTYSKNNISQKDKYFKKTGRLFCEHNIAELIRDFNSNIQRNDNMKLIINSYVFNHLRYYFERAKKYFKFKNDVYIIYKGDNRNNNIFYSKFNTIFRVLP